jgi:hypothetical protein
LFKEEIDGKIVLFDEETNVRHECEYSVRECGGCKELVHLSENRSYDKDPKTGKFTIKHYCQ